VAAEDPDLCWQAVGPDDGRLLVAGAPVARVPRYRAVTALLDAAEAFLAGSDGAWRTRPAGSPPAAPATPAPVGPSGDAGPHAPIGGPGGDGRRPAPAPASGPGRDAGPHAPIGGPGGGAEPLAGHAGPPLGWVGGGAALVGAPVLGEMSAAQLRALADTAPRAIVTPWRTVVLPGAREGADAQLAAAGFVVDPASPGAAGERLRRTAGMRQRHWPTCGADARAGLAAGRFTRARAPLGCARRCGSPRGPHRALVALAEGQYAG
jgi:precorrin-3B synthase